MSPSSAPIGTDGKARCAWLHDDSLMLAYHDEEWGVPERDDRALYEKLVLDGAQAGLSWKTILHRREGYRRAFRGFQPDKIARWGERQIERLLADQGIIRNRQKVRSAIANARAFLAVQDELGSFAGFVWGFVDSKPIVNRWKSLAQVPPQTPLSETVSKELVRRGFSFVGPTIVYAYMQAIGMINDHVTKCHRWREVQEI
ncbi:MAG: DNA-3-methyladenine glycosylase I [Thermoanaerobaculia bacterium]